MKKIQKNMIIITVLLVISLLFGLSECSMKWDRKVGKNSTTNEVEIVEVNRIIFGPKTNGIVSFY